MVHPAIYLKVVFKRRDDETRFEAPIIEKLMPKSWLLQVIGSGPTE
jgi:hypothetical protein